ERFGTDYKNIGFGNLVLAESHRHLSISPVTIGCLGIEFGPEEPDDRSIPLPLRTREDETAVDQLRVRGKALHAQEFLGSESTARRNRPPGNGIGRADQSSLPGEGMRRFGAARPSEEDRRRASGTACVEG